MKATRFTLLGLLCFLPVFGQQIYVNELYRSGNLSSTDEWIEVVLAVDLTDSQLNGFFVGDSTSSTAAKFSAYRFTNMGTIATIFPAGTIIVVGGDTAFTEDTSYDPNGGDWNIFLNTSGSFITDNGNGGDLAGTDVAYVDTLGSGDTISVNGFGVNWDSSPGVFGGNANVTLSNSPDNVTGASNGAALANADQAGSWISDVLLASLTPGLPNGGANSTAIQTLRDSLSSFIVINEVDSETPNGDTEEFIELYGPPNTPLDGYVLVLFSGTTDTSYDAIDLDSYSIGATGFFVICVDSSAVDNCDLDVTESSNWLANGPDAVAIFTGNDTDFPNGTPVTTTGLVDAVVYDTDDADDPGLLILTPAQPQVNESGGTSSLDDAIARVPDGGTPLETTTYAAKAPTPGMTNLMIPGLKINELVANHSGIDEFEYVEILGDPDTDISSYWFLQIDGNTESNPGTIFAAIQCGTTNASGYWFSGFLMEALENNTATFMLVENFSGSVSDDLDTNDDGILDITPWTKIQDSLAIDDSDTGDQTYATIVFTPGFDGDIFAPGGLSRYPDGTNTGQLTDWKRNAFNGTGIPGFSGDVQSNEVANTPNEPNSKTPSLSCILNEVVTHHTGGTDDHEYLEISGTPSTDYSEFTILQLDGDLSANPGQILSAHPLGTTDLSGLWDTGFLTGTLQNTSLSLLLVKGFSGSTGNDLDSNNDGILDATPWTIIDDSITILRNPADVSYSSVVFDDSFDSEVIAPDGASRIPNGVNTRSVTDWIRNDFDGAGLSGFSGTLVSGEALNTPGEINVTTENSGTNAVINEFVANHTGTDDHEYVEIYGDPDTNYSSLWILVVEGDIGDNPGTIDQFWQCGQTDANGYWYTGFVTDQMEDTTLTLLLVSDFTGTLGMDLDTGDVGTIDVTPWTAIVDSVGVMDNGTTTDFVYSTTNLAQSYDGVSYTVGGASRIPNGTDTDSTADWIRNDYSGEGLPGFTGSLVPGEALNTPGTENSDQLPPETGSILSEFVIDHTGTDTHQFLEIFGKAHSPYTSTWVLIIDGDVVGNPGVIDNAYQVGTTNNAGFWDTGYLDQAIPTGTLTILVVEEFTGSVGNDLDTNDDGVLDSTPWGVLSDSVAIDDGGAGDLVFSTVSLGAVGGASRFPYGQDTDTNGDWRQNDFEGYGLDGFVGNLDPGEAINTLGMVNRIGFQNGDYYEGVDESTSTALRNSLHEIIRGHVYFPYTDDGIDTWDILEMADEDPNNSSNVLTIYKNAIYAKAGGGNNYYNREHLWAKSYGFPDDFENTYPYTDCHHLHLSDSIYNSTRNNLAFGTCNETCNELPTDINNGQGGGSGIYPGNSNWYSGSGGNGTFEVWHDKRGDVARSMLYMDVRYEGGDHPFTNAFEPDLILTDDVNLIQTTGINANIGYLGRLAVLLKWNQDDPVDNDERLRNEVVYQFQGNRNPFVDHPEWVSGVFGKFLDPCIASALPYWHVEQSQCVTGLISVLDFVHIVNGTCVCQ